MLQIFINYLFVFILPFLIGFGLRFAIRKLRWPFLLTVCLLALAVIMQYIAETVPNHGSELYAIMALEAVSLAAGALIAGIITCLFCR